MNKLKTRLQYVIPQHLLSALIGKLAHCRRPCWLKRRAIKKFTDHYGVNLTEAAIQDYKQYASFNDFFTRKLMPHARPVDKDRVTLVSPSDGCISEIGTIQAGKLLQAKGIEYDLHTLIGGNVEEAAWFEQGVFATIYLAPKDYHRVHMPYTGHFLKKIVIPGKLFSVNFQTQYTVPRLFNRNERIVTLFQTDHGKMAVIFVGAMIVGHIVLTAVEDSICEKGTELGYFQLGSTVIVLFEANKLVWQQGLSAGSTLSMGQPLGKLII